ncbi:MAG: type II toxin-antitoxin system YafQ family toxin [Rudaea sp.]|uniref:type II toxin-antitoxin system YafQ family toxin n=1 Tax=Rudaea sp. TaxID=2136325 RepID=UPI0039E5A510
MSWKLVFRKRFDRDLERLHDLRGAAFDLEGLKYALTFLADGQPLPVDFSDHALMDDWAHRREFHLAGDDLVLPVETATARSDSGTCRHAPAAFHQAPAPQASPVRAHAGYHFSPGSSRPAVAES